MLARLSALSSAINAHTYTITEPVAEFKCYFWPLWDYYHRGTEGTE